MPPKKDPKSKKTEDKQKNKVIEDKTFGLKNKKGAKQQKFVQHVTHQVKHGNVSASKLEATKAEDRKKKKEKDELGDLNKLLKPVTDMPKVSKDVDPKSVLCVFFKQGMCSKGAKCKFSHDLQMERKAEKKNLYVDSRESENADTMENWDEAKLNEVVEQKHGEADKNKPKTAIVCKYFLEAVENSKYGWFWECPNGGKCIYRHALPPGFILKKEKKKLDEMKEEEISLEELVEKERALLGGNLTKVTLETFLAWKKRKVQEKKTKAVADEKRKRTEFQAGRQGGLSGRDLFTFNPDLVAQDDEEAGEYSFKPDPEDEDQEEEVEAVEIDERMFVLVEEDEGVQFNEELFDPDDMPDSDSDQEQSDPDQPTSSAKLFQNGLDKLHFKDDVT